MILDYIYGSPFWAVLLAFLALGLAFAWASQIVARHVVGRHRLDGHAEVVNFAVANIAVLYGVLLAFLTVVCWEGLSKASDAADVEAGLVANLYHDAQGLPAPLDADVGGHVRHYLETIIDREWPMQAKGQVPQDGSASLAALHRHVASLSPADRGDAVVMADMMHSLNELDVARATRLGSLGGHVPGLVWSLIVGMGLLLIGFATLIPARDARLQGALLGGFVLATVMVLVMIVELDNPYRGAVSVSDEAYRRARADILQLPPANDAD